MKDFNLAMKDNVKITRMLNTQISFGQMKFVKWMKMFYPPQLGKSFIDEDEGDEDGEDFLGKA